MSKMNLADIATALPLSTLLAAPCFPQAVPFPRWQRARDCACAALLAGETRLLLTGPVGSGKTLLVNDIARVYLQFSDDRGTTWSEAKPIDASTPAHAEQFNQMVAVNRDGVVGVHGQDDDVGPVHVLAQQPGAFEERRPG